jgi:microcystin-dependent protein
VECDGRSLSATAFPVYQTLYERIGTVFGGTGPEAFNLPNMMSCNGFTGCTPIKTSPSFPLNSQGGAQSHTLSMGEMPAHNHGNAYHSHEVRATTFDDANNNGGDGAAARGDTPWLQRNINVHGGATPMNHEGGNGAHNNMPPTFNIGCIIRVY